jgi:CrcB protein
LKILLAVFLGGGFGSLARFGIGKWALSTFSHELPIGTLIANVLSCVILGIVVKLSQQEVFSGFWITFLVIGFCGGFSTFSTFSYETLMLMQHGKWIWAGFNIVISMVSCLLVLFVLSKQFS